MITPPQAAEPDPAQYSGDFWRKRLAEALGVDPSLDDSLLESALAKHMRWRHLAADAIGAHRGLSDAGLLQKHGEHMAQVRAGGKKASAAANARAVVVQALVNGQIERSPGLSYDAAFDLVRRRAHPLFAIMIPPTPRS